MATTQKTLEELEQEAIDALSSGGRRTRSKVFYSALGALSFFAIWAYYSTVLEPYVLPSPLAVGQKMWELTTSGDVFINFGSSFLKTMAGWAMALVLGIPIGLLMGRYRYARAFFHDFVYLFANVPLLVYAVIAIIVFGISPWGPAFVVMLEAFTGIAINVAAGVQSVDRGLLAMSRSFRRSSGRTVRSIVVPVRRPVPVRERSGVVRELVEAGGARRDVRRVPRVSATSSRRRSRRSRSSRCSRGCSSSSRS